MAHGGMRGWESGRTTPRGGRRGNRGESYHTTRKTRVPWKARVHKNLLCVESFKLVEKLTRTVLDGSGKAKQSNTDVNG